MQIILHPMAQRKMTTYVYFCVEKFLFFKRVKSFGQDGLYFLKMVSNSCIPGTDVCGRAAMGVNLDSYQYLCRGFGRQRRVEF